MQSKDSTETSYREPRRLGFAEGIWVGGTITLVVLFALGVCFR